MGRKGDMGGQLNLFYSCFFIPKFAQSASTVNNIGIGVGSGSVRYDLIFHAHAHANAHTAV